MHLPVLLEESLEYLKVEPGKTYLDATAGAGGHLSAIAKMAGESSTVIGLDRDINVIERLGGLADLPSNIRLFHSNFSDIKSVLADSGIGTISGGILADLGVSSMQIDNAERGFSFQQDGPLDMRMDTTSSLSAHTIVNEFSEKEIADIIFHYGEDRHARAIARAIVKSRPIDSTMQLASIVTKSLARFAGKNSKHNKNPATRTFQAIRMAVNEELLSLEKFLEDASSCLEPGARLVIITFHSLEDRMVKQFFRTKSLQCICPPRHPVCTCNTRASLQILTKKPIVASSQEIDFNSRARSAKLRAAEKLDDFNHNDHP
ncbi:MAG: 16S rRNA (cytosine(1402)-N(4))-methyltransferase RsmH [Candidatus Melainabacteria bacterium]|nr:16S rRNA (cytosine(1402)-N(4))-methyltransferase RsmH [Candidatus Melainabacteria bacterium]